jgi:hypothetical protein
VADRDIDTASKHRRAAATIRVFAERTGAERVVVLLDEGEERPATMLEWLGGDAVEVTDADGAHALVPDGEAPLPLPDLRRIPASTVELDADVGEVSAPLGAVVHLATGVLELARAFGGRTVATADFPTAEPDLPLTIAAREGEPLVLGMGDRQFSLPDGWPDA